MGSCGGGSNDLITGKARAQPHMTLSSTATVAVVPQRMSPDGGSAGGLAWRSRQLPVRQMQAPQPADIFLHSYNHEGGHDIVFINPLASSGLLFVQPGGERGANGALRRLHCGSVGSSVSVPSLGASIRGCSIISVAGSRVASSVAGDSGVGKVGSEVAVQKQRVGATACAVIIAAARAFFCGWW